jgi:hypothetical protein
MRHGIRNTGIAIPFAAPFLTSTQTFFALH